MSTSSYFNLDHRESLEQGKIKSRAQSPIIPSWVEKNSTNGVLDVKKMLSTEQGQVLYNFLSSLPNHLQQQIEVTSHIRPTSSKSIHSTGRALDIRIPDIYRGTAEGVSPMDYELFNHLVFDLAEQRKELGISILNPFHGTAPHIHISVGSEKELDYDIAFGEKAFPNTTVDFDRDTRQFKLPGETPEELPPLDLRQAAQQMMESFSNEQAKKQHMTQEFLKMQADVAEIKELVSPQTQQLTEREQQYQKYQEDQKRKMDFVRDFKLEYGYNDEGRREFSEGGTNRVGAENEDQRYQNFVSTLPDNLRNNDERFYNMRGYWEALGSPSEFDYSQPKEEDGFYHAFSRNPNTGEILKTPQHPTFRMAIEGDVAAGYTPYKSPEGRIFTFGESDEIPEGYTPYTLPQQRPHVTKTINSHAELELFKRTDEYKKHNWEVERKGHRFILKSKN